MGRYIDRIQHEIPSESFAKRLQAYCAIVFSLNPGSILKKQVVFGCLGGL